MRKIYLLATAVGMAGIASAQMQGATSLHQKSENIRSVRTLVSQERTAGDIYFEDEIQDETNWTIVNEGQGNWTRETSTSAAMDFYMGTMASATAANGFYLFDAVQFLEDGSVETQNSMLTLNSDVDCGLASSLSLQFDQRYRAYNYDETWVDVSVDGGTTWDFSVQINEDAEGNGPSIQSTEIVNIPGAGENDVRIRFRWTCTSDDDQYGSGYGWAIDDVKIIETWENDHQLGRSYALMGDLELDYYYIPDTQISEILFTAEACNNGTEDQTNSKLNADITGMETASFTSTPTTFVAGTCDSVNTTSNFTPTAGIGDYNVAMYFDSDETEQVTSADTSTSVISITDGIYSRDNGSIGGRISNVTDNTELSLKIGNVMEIMSDIQVGYVRVGISDQDGTAVGQLINVEIQKYNDASGEYEYLVDSDDYTIESGDEGALVEIRLSNPVDVVAGDVLLVLAGHYGGTDEVAFMTAQTTYEQTVLGYTDDGSSFYLSDPGAVIIRLVEQTVSVEENDALVASTSVYPNPANDVATINFTLNEVANVSINVVDYTGKVISTENLGSVANGAHTINTASISEGIYFVNLVVNGNVTTNKLVVSKK